MVQAVFKQQVLIATGPCVKLQQPLCSLINRVQRLFFLNEAQNLSSFLIADLGVAKYPSYTVTRSRSVFTCRQDLMDYEQALEHAAELDNALEVSKAQLIAANLCCRDSYASGVGLTYASVWKVCTHVPHAAGLYIRCICPVAIAWDLGQSPAG